MHTCVRVPPIYTCEFNNNWQPSIRRERPLRGRGVFCEADRKVGCLLRVFPIPWRSALYSWLWSPHTRRFRFLACVAAFAVYIIFFTQVSSRLGPTIGMLVSLPVVFAALCFGPYVGVALSLAAFPLNTWLFNAFEMPPPPFKLRLMEGLVLLPTSFLVGTLRLLVMHVYRDENKYRRLFEGAPLMYVTAVKDDGNLVISDCNAAFLSTLEYRRQEVIGRPLAEFCDPSDRKGLCEVGVHHILTQGLYGIECRLRTRRGQKVETLFFSIPEKDAGGDVLGVLGMFVDIGELKHLEQRLRQREVELFTRNRILSLMLEVHDLDALLQGILQEVLKFTGAERGGVYVLEDKGYKLRVVENMSAVDSGHPGVIPPEHIAPLLEDIHTLQDTSPEWGDIFPCPQLVDSRICLFLPLRLPPGYAESDAYPIGLMVLAAREPHTFRASHKRALMTMGQQIALAIAHTRTYLDAQQRLSRLQALRDVDLAIIRNLDMETIVNIVLERIPRGLGAEAVALSLIDEKTGQVELFAMRLPNGTIVHEDVFRVAEVLPWFVEHPEPLVISDVATDPRTAPFRSIIQRYKVVAYLGVPLIMGDELIGVLHLVTTRPRTFAEEDVAFFRTLAGQVAIGIANARMVADLRERAHAVSVMLSSTLPQDQLLQEGALERHLTRVWREALDLDGVEFFVPDSRAGEMRLLHREGVTGPPLSFPIGEEKGLVGWVAHTRTPVYLPDCMSDPRWLSFVPDIRSVYIVPVVWQDTLFGVVTFFSKRSHAFSKTRRQLIDLFVQQGAVRLENMQMLQSSTAHAALLDILSDVALEIEGVSTLLDVANVSGRGMQRLCQPTDVFFYLNQNEEVRCIWSIGQSAHLADELTDLVLKLPEGRVLEKGRPFLVNDVNKLPVDSPLRLWATRARCAAFSLLPLMHAKQILGYIGCCWKDPYYPPPYGQEVVQTFSHLVAAALARAQLHTDLRQANVALEKALEARDDMLRNVTHELRTPLTMVRGYAELMEMGLISDPDEVQEYGGIILQNAKHLQSLLDQLLLFQQLRFGEKEIALEPLDIAQWLRRVSREWQHAVKEQGQHLVLDLREPLPHVLGNQEHLRQVLNNLLDNARKFSPEKGTITLRAWQEGDEVFVSVSDEGIGIPPDQLDKIFERFYQVDASPTRTHGGMGIGLALCKEIVELHGGRVWAESEGEGKGATITFTLPVAPPTT